MHKTVYKRLNENTIICIDKYCDEIGDKYHRVILRYEDTSTNVEIGTFKTNKGFFNNSTNDSYSFNNNYILCYKYVADKKCLKIERLYNINSRCDMLTEDKFYNYYTCVDAEEDIKKNKCKRLSLGNKSKKVK